MWQSLIQSVSKIFRQGKVESPVSNERRRMDRIKILLTLVCQSVEHEEPFRIMTENMNILGIKFVSPIELQISEILIMKMLLHSNFPHIICNGRVVWCKKKLVTGKPYYEGGIEFIGLTEKDQQFLQKFIDRYKIDELDDKESNIS